MATQGCELMLLAGRQVFQTRCESLSGTPNSFLRFKNGKLKIAVVHITRRIPKSAGIGKSSLRLALFQQGSVPIPDNYMQSSSLKLSVMLASQDKKLER